MTKKSWVLLVLAVATALYQGFCLYHVFGDYSGAIRLNGSGLIMEVKNGRLTVLRVLDVDGEGRPSSAKKAGFEKGDQILGIYDRDGGELALTGLNDLEPAMRRFTAQDPIKLKIGRTENGQPREMPLTLEPLKKQPFAQEAALPAVVALVVLLSIFTGFFIGFSKPQDEKAFLACLLLLGFATIFTLRTAEMGPGWREAATVYFTFLNSFLTYWFFRFFLLFPSPSVIDRKAPWLKTVFLLMTAVMFAYSLTANLLAGFSFKAYSPFEGLFSVLGIAANVLLLAMFLLAIVSLVLNTIQARTKDERRRLLILLLGATVGLVPSLSYITFVQYTGKGLSFLAIFFCFLLFGLFPLSFVYVVLKHRVFGIRLIIRRGLQWALVSRGFLVVEGVLIFLVLFFAAGPALAAAMPQLGSSVTAVGTAVLTAALVVGFRETNRRIMPSIDRRFFREAYDARLILTQLGQAVRSLAGDPDRLLQTVAEKVMDSLHPDRVAVFLRGKEIANLPPGGEEARVWSPQKAAPFGEAFLCYAWTGGSGRGRALVPESPGAQDFILPGDSLAAGQLKRAEKEDPQAVEVYLDDAESWAAPLSAPGAGEAATRERTLLQGAGARLLVPLVTKSRLIGFLLLGEKRSEEPYSKEDKELLLAVAQQTAIALDYAELIGEAAEKATLKRDLQIATEVQQKLFPQTYPPVPGLDYAGLCKPARGVGGDYYDFITLDGGHQGFALGDISGKGVPAALLMASLQAMLRSQAPLRGENVEDLVSAVNKLLGESTDGSKFATFFYGVYDVASRNLTYVNAGHNPPMLFRPGSPEPERLPATGMILGLFPEAAYTRSECGIGPSDVLLIFSDGATEAFNAAGEEFGEERLVAAVSSRLHLDAAELCQAILSEIALFAGETAQSDDITLLVVKGTGKGSEC